MTLQEVLSQPEQPTMPQPTVFISYSHDSPEHQQRVLALAEQLRTDGVEAWIDQYTQDPDEGWIRWMRSQVKQASRVLLVFTETYQRRFEGDEEEGKGLGATFEGVIVTQTLYESGGRTAKFRPVVFGEEDEKFIPAELRQFNRYRVDSPENYEALLRWLHEAPRIIASSVGQKASEPSKVFISYNRADRDWAEWIAGTIERTGYEPILDLWHFRPGQNFVVWMQRASAEADITIAVLSEAYLKAEFTQPEWARAFAQDPTGEKRQLIPVRVNPCSLPGLLKPIKYIDLVGLGEQDAERALVDGLKPSGRPTQPTRFPKEPADPGMSSGFPPNVSSASLGALFKDHDAATRIFICYRRDDSSGHAGRLFDALAKKFGESKIFMDVAGIEPGADFVEVIEKSVASCHILLAVIGRNWLAYRGSKRKRRLDDPNDYVRLEIQAALKKGIRIIPIFVQGAQMPGVDSLPEDIRKLARKQGFDLRDNRWNDDVTSFISSLQRMRSAS